MERTTIMKLKFRHNFRWGCVSKLQKPQLLFSRQLQDGCSECERPECEGDWCACVPRWGTFLRESHVGNRCHQCCWLWPLWRCHWWKSGYEPAGKTNLEKVAITQRGNVMLITWQCWGFLVLSIQLCKIYLPHFAQWCMLNMQQQDASHTWNIALNAGSAKAVLFSRCCMWVCVDAITIFKASLSLKGINIRGRAQTIPGTEGFSHRQKHQMATVFVTAH